MRSSRTGIFLVALVVVLAACGRVPPTSTAETPSPAESPSLMASPSPAAPLTIAGPALPAGEVALAYKSVTYQATGGNAPYLWSVSGGALPGGLSLTPDGVLSGTPAASGTFSFTLQVTDAGMATAAVSGKIVVAPRLALYYVGEAAQTDPPGHVGVCTMERLPCHPCPVGNRYNPFAAVSGGVAPYRYAVVSGTLPPGTSLNGLALAGTYQQARWSYTFTVRVTDSLGVIAMIAATYDLWGYQNFCPTAMLTSGSTTACDA